MSSPFPGSTAVTFAGHEFHLLADRALWWPARSTLLIGDAHFGKSAAFRATGLPVPEGPTGKDLARLTTLLGQTRAQRLVVLGDLLHSRAGRQPEVFGAIAAWRARHVKLPILLVRGNHDRSAGRAPEEWDLHQVEEPFDDDGVSLLHDPDCHAPHPSLAGHVHPIFALQDYDGSSVTLPCFVFDETCAILPSFGTFTGGYRITQQVGRRIFLVASGRVVPLPQRAG